MSFWLIIPSLSRSNAVLFWECSRTNNRIKFPRFNRRIFSSQYSRPIKPFRSILKRDILHNTVGHVMLKSSITWRVKRTNDVRMRLHDLLFWTESCFYNVHVSLEGLNKLNQTESNWIKISVEVELYAWTYSSYHVKNRYLLSSVILSTGITGIYPAGILQCSLAIPICGLKHSSCPTESFYYNDLLMWFNVLFSTCIVG